MNYHRENKLVKKKYAIRWNHSNKNEKEADSGKKAENLKHILEEREARILKSIGNISQNRNTFKPQENNKQATEDTYGAIYMKIHDRCLSGDEDAEDHFAI